MLAVNKADLGAAWELSEAGGEPDQARRVSAREGAGVEELCEALGRALTAGEPEPRAGEVVASARQAEALERALYAVRQAAAELASPEPAVEVVSLELATALAALGEVDGQGAPEEVIEAVFSEFCLGK